MLAQYFLPFVSENLLRRWIPVDNFARQIGDVNAVHHLGEEERLPPQRLLVLFTPCDIAVVDDDRADARIVQKIGGRGLDPAVVALPSLNAEFGAHPRLGALDLFHPRQQSLGVGRLHELAREFSNPLFWIENWYARH